MFLWMILLPMWTRCWDVWYWFVFCVCNTNGFPFAWFPVQKLRNSGRRRVWQVKSLFWFFTILFLYYIVDKRCIFNNSRTKNVCFFKHGFLETILCRVVPLISRDMLLLNAGNNWLWSIVQICLYSEYNFETVQISYYDKYLENLLPIIW